MAKPKASQPVPSSEKSAGPVILAVMEHAPHRQALETKLASLKNAPALAVIGKEVPEQAAGYYFFVSAVQVEHISQVWQAVQGMRKAVSRDKLGVVSFRPSKSGLGSRLKHGLYDLVVQILTPLSSPAAGLVGTLVHADLLPAVIETGLDPSGISGLHQLRLEEFKDEPVSLGAPYPAFSLLGNVLKLKVSAVTSRFKYYLVKPLQQGLFKGSPADGNDPLYRFLFASIALVALIAMPLLSQQFGITWDEALHNKYGYDMVNYYATMGKDTTCFNSHPHFPYYGEHFNLYTATLHTWFPSWDEFGTRHFLNALYGFLAILYIGLIGRELGSWRTAFLAITFALLNPQLFGHSMNNPTDIPFATGYIIAAFYFIRILKQLPNPKTGTSLLAAWGIGMALGSRAGALVLFAYLGLMLFLHWFVRMRQEKQGFRIKSLWPYVRTGLLVGITGYILGILFWPYALSHPLTGPLTAMKRSTNPDFFTINHELFDGVREYMGYAPWYYIPKYLIIQTPVVSLLGAALTIFGLFWLLKRKNAGGLLLLGFMVIFPLVYAEIQNMYYYNGWRHFLFVYTGFIALSALGWEFLLRFIKNRWINLGLVAAILLLVAKPAAWMVKNHPHEYTYFNELVGGVSGAYTNYEIDYYANCMRSAAEWLCKNEDVKSRKIKVATNMEVLASKYYIDKFTDSVEVVWVREYEKYKQDWDYFLFSPRTMSKNQLTLGGYPPKGTIHEIKADDAILVAIVKDEHHHISKGYKLLETSPDSALTEFNQAIAYDPKNEEAYRFAGMALMRMNRFPEADKMMDKAIEFYPENPYAWHYKGIIAVETGKPDSALECFTKSKEYKINYFDPQLQAAYILLNKQRYPEAQAMLEKSIRYAGAMPEAYLYLGVAMLYNGKYQKAIENLSIALKLNPKMKMAYDYIAEAYTKLGDNKRAEAFRRQGASIQ